MPIAFKTADQPLTSRPPVVVICGPPGMGKTTLACSVPNSALMDFDQRGDQAATRATRTAEPTSWKDLDGLHDDPFLAGMEYVIVDTAGRAIDSLANVIMAEDPKNTNGQSLSLKGFGVLKGRFTRWLDQLRSTGRCVILVVHSTETRRGDETVERLDITGGSKDFIYQKADVMGRVSVINGERTWITEPSENSFGKDPTGVGRRKVPLIPATPFILHDWITEIREVIRERAEARSEDGKAASAMREKADACATPADLTKLAKDSHEAPMMARAAILASGTNRGWKWSKSEDGFVDPNSKPSPAEASDAAKAPI